MITTDETTICKRKGFGVNENASKSTMWRTELSRIIWVLVIIVRVNRIKKVPKKVLQIGAFIIANNYRG